jgi:hypothetical protein
MIDRRQRLPAWVNTRFLASGSATNLPSPLARRHRLLPSQLTTWRRQAREGRIALPVDAPGLPTPAEFVPLVVDAPDPTPNSDRGRDRIEIETGGMVIRLPGTITVCRLAEIVGALRSTRA